MWYSPSVARIMKIFCTSPLPSLYHFLSEAFIGLYYYESFHGEQCARLNINRSVHGWKYHPSKMMIICAPLLFFSPVTSVHHLHTTFVDRLVIRVRWNAFVTRLCSQLEDSNLLVSLIFFSYPWSHTFSTTGYGSSGCQCRVPGHHLSRQWERGVTQADI